MGKAGGSMNMKIKYLLGVLWLFFFSVAFAALWLRTPALWFINLPQSVWESLAVQLGQTCCESMADLEIVVGLVFGFLIALVLMWVFFCIARSLRKK